MICKRLVAVAAVMAVTSAGVLQERGILDALTDGTKLGTALKAIEALGKASSVFNEMKQLVPDVHDQFQNTIGDVHNALQDIIDTVTHAFGGASTTAKPQKRGLLDSLTDGTKLGTALKAIEALGKASSVFNEIKQLVPDVHNQFQNTIGEVHNALQDIIDSVTHVFGGATTPAPQPQKRGILDALTDGTKLGTALKAIEALGKASSVFNEIKQLVPDVHNQFQNTIGEVHNALQDIIDSVTHAFGGAATTATPKKRGLLDSLTDGTKLGTALKAIEALGKASSVFNEIKQLMPDVHNQFQNTIGEVHNALQDIIDSVTHAFGGATTPAPQPQKRGILDALTDGTKLGTALKAIEALGKASSVFNEMKQLVPDVHDQFQNTIGDVHNALQDIIDSVTKAFGGATATTPAPTQKSRVKRFTFTVPPHPTRPQGVTCNCAGGVVGFSTPRMTYPPWAVSFTTPRATYPPGATTPPTRWPVGF